MSEMPPLPANFDPNDILKKNYERFWRVFYPWIRQLLKERYDRTAKMIERSLSSLITGLYVRAGKSIERNLDASKDPRNYLARIVGRYIGEEVKNWAVRAAQLQHVEDLERLHLEIAASADAMSEYTVDKLGKCEHQALQKYASSPRDVTRTDIFLRLYSPILSAANPTFKGEELRDIALERSMTASRVRSIYNEECDVFFAILDSFLSE